MGVFDIKNQQQETEEQKQQRIETLVENTQDKVLLNTPDLYVKSDMPANYSQPQQSNGFVSDTAKYIKESNVWKNLFYTDQEKLIEAKSFTDKYGVPTEVILRGGTDALNNLRAMDNTYETNKKIFGQEGKQFSLDNLYEMYPEMKSIVDKDTNSAVLALKNMQNVQETKGIFDSIVTGYNRMQDYIKRGDVGARMAQGEDTPELQAELTRLEDNLKKYRTTDGSAHPLEKVLGETAAQGGMMLTQYTRGASVGVVGGALAGAVIGGATTGGLGAVPGAVAGMKYGADAGFAEEMFRNSVGNKYLDNVKRGLDKNMSRKQALTYGAIDTAIEFVATKYMAKAVGKVTPNSALKEIMNNASERVALARGSLTTMLKTSGKVGGSELLEEGLQDVNDKLQDNAYGVKHNSLGDIIEGAVGAMIDAVPSVVGLGLLGGVGGNVKSIRNIINASDGMRKVAVQQEINNVGANVLSQLKENQSSNSLFKKSPEVYAQVVQTQADKIGMGTMYVDVEVAMQSDKGVNALNKMVENGVIKEEQLKQAIETGGTLEVPVGEYMQKVAPNVEDNALHEATAWTDGGINLGKLKMMQEHYSNIQQRIAKEQENIHNQVVNELYDEHFKDSDVALDVLNKNVFDLKRSYLDTQRHAEEVYNELVGMERFKEGMGQGVTVIPTEDGKGVRASNNAKWYSDFYAQNKRKPTNYELRHLALENLSEEVYQQAKTEEEQARADEVLNEAQTQLEYLDKLEGLKDKFYELADSDYMLRKTLSKEGLEVYKDVYNTLMNGNGNLQAQAKESAYLFAKHADIMAGFMQHAGVKDYTAKDYAKMHGVQIGGAVNSGAYNQFAGDGNLERLFGDSEYFEDIKSFIGSAITFKDLQNDFGFDKASDIMGDIRAGLIKILEDKYGDNLEFSRDESFKSGMSYYLEYTTDEWETNTKIRMSDHPNNYGTEIDIINGIGLANFLESQGINIYNQSIDITETAEFKNWFGDSKVVDEDGKPLVMYHGTISDFEEFTPNNRGVYFFSPNKEWVSKFLTDNEGNVTEGAKVMPVYINAKNPFDFKNKEHVKKLAIQASLGKSAIDQIKKGSWSRLEDRSTLQAIKALGFDGLYVMEEGVKNLAVFSPEQIKSVNNKGTFNPNDVNIYNQKVDNIIKESKQLYDEVVNKFPDIVEDRRVKKRVENALQTTLDFGELPDEIIKQTSASDFGGQGGEKSQNEKRKNNSVRNNERIGEQIALGVTRKLVNEGAISLVGHKVNNVRELAELAQVLRHPGYEKFHRIYTNDNNEIIHHETVSCMMPSEASILSPEDDGKLSNLLGRMDNEIRTKKASKVYLIHNHPSTNPSPSSEDIEVTKNIANLTTSDGKTSIISEKFAGHIILDTDKYCEIKKDGSFDFGKIDEKYQIKMSEAELPSINLGKVVNSPSAIADLAKNLFDTSKTTAFLMTTKNEVRGVFQLPQQLTTLSKDKILRYLRWLTRGNYSNRMAIVTENENDYNALLPLVEKGHILDMMLTKPFGEEFARSKVEVKKTSGWMGIPSGENTKRLLEESETYNQSAWHGSPYKFDKFSLEHIGNGEGNQAYGWGLYFAGNKKIAQWYKDVLGDTLVFSKDGEKVSWEEAKQLYFTPGNVIPRVASNDPADVVLAYNSETNAVTVERYEAKGFFRGTPNSEDLQHDKRFTRFAKITFNANVTANELKAFMLANGFDAKKDGNLYEVDIKAEENEMLDWDKPFTEQSDYVQSLLTFLRNKYRETEGREGVYFDDDWTGEEIYKSGFNWRSGNDKNPEGKSKVLNVAGIEGIKYLDGSSRDKGEGSYNYVIFNDNAVDIINTYEQQNRGSLTVYNTGKTMMQLFKSADYSTFIHESGHLFLEDIRMLAELENAPKEIKQAWETVKEWTGWVDGANNTEAHEKFAKGFETYMREGKAPSNDLKAVFRKFKAWLVQVYENLTRLGEVPPKEIQRIMDMMIATDTEIENYVDTQDISSFNKKGFGDLEGNDKGIVKRWKQEIIEKIKERVHGEFMKSYTEQARQEKAEFLERYRVDIERKLIQENKFYEIENLYKEFGKPVLDKYGITKEQLQEELNKLGGNLDYAVDMKVLEEEKAIDNTIIKGEELKRFADEYLLSDEGQSKIVALERDEMQRKANAVTSEIMKAMRLLNAEEIDVKEVSKVINDLFGTEKSKTNNLKVQLFGKSEEINKLKEQLNELTGNNENKKFVISELKKQLNDNLRKLRMVRDATTGNQQLAMEQARRILSQSNIGEAVAFKSWQQKAIVAGKQADAFLVKGDFEKAMYRKNDQLLHLSLAKVAHDNEKRINKAVEKLKTNNERISRSEKPIRLGGQERYFYQHLMYKLGLNNSDVLEPTNGFDMKVIKGALNPDVAVGISEGDDGVISRWVENVFYGENPINWRKLRLEQFEEISTLLGAIYKVGRREYEGSTILDENGNSMSFEDASNALMLGLSELDKPSTNRLQEQNSRDLKDEVKSKANSYLLELTKPETIFNRIDGGKAGFWYNLLYRPIERGANKERELMRDANKTLKKIMSRYSAKELRVIRSNRKYQLGKITGFTKEQIMVLALNWGTENNKQRVIGGLNANGADVDVVKIEKVFGEVLTNKDWDFIEDTWKLINSYWQERNDVQERLYGVPLGKEEAVSFTINGREMSGGYYPIVYDGSLSVKASEQDVNEIVKQQLSSNAVFGVGMGSTKKRATKVDRMLLLSFDVMPKAVTEAVHHVSMRECSVDVYKLLSRKEVETAIIDKFGIEYYKVLKQWARDNWQTEIKRMDVFERTLNALKRNTTFATLAYRTSTAIINASNIFPMAKELGGVANAVKALYGFYNATNESYKNNRQFVLSKSSFLAERVHNLDKDMTEGLKIGGKQGRIMDGKDTINRYGYFFITETDLMLSLPLWKQTYKTTVAELLKTKTDTALIESEAIAKADRAVRRVFGSGEAKDLANIQKRQGLLSFLTPFYTYCNAVLNSLIEAGYQVKDKGNVMPLFNAMLFWIVLPTMVETLIRSSYDSDDDDLKTIAKKYGINLGRNAMGGIPLVRDISDMTLTYAMGERTFSKGNTVMALSIGEKFYNLIESVKSDKKDWVDVGRSASQVGNRVVGFSDTLSDGWWSLMKFTFTDTDASVSDLIQAIIFDKKVQEKKKKKKKTGQ